MQKGRKALKLAAVFIMSLVFSLAVPSLSVSADGSLTLENDCDYIGNMRMSDGQVIHDRVSFPFRLGNNYASRLDYTINFRLPYPALAPGVSVRVTDAYLVIGNERIEFSYDDGRSDIYFWSRGITSEIVTDYSYGGIYVEFEISCSLTTAQIRDQRTISYSTVQDAYTEKFAGTASTLFSGNVSNTSHYVKNMSSLNSYLVETYTSQYGGLKASTSIGDLRKEVPLRRSSSSRSSSGLIYYDLPGVQLPTVKVQCTNYNISFGRSNVADLVSDLNTHSLLREIRDQGGTNADVGTHNRLDSMMQQQQQAAQDQLMESEKQTDALTNFDGKGTMDSSKTELDSVMGSYDETERNLFESAGNAIGAIDMIVSLKPSAGVLGGIQYLSGFITGIIAAMGEFSMLYTAGYVILIIIILFGLFKYTTSDTKNK